MAPIKFDENIREKLEGRELQPSADAWKKLNDKLDVTEERGSNKVMWYAIAASFVGILIVGSVFFSRNETPSENNKDFVEVHTSEKEVINEMTEFKKMDNAPEDKSSAIATEKIESKAIKNTKVEDIIKTPPKKKEVVMERLIQNKTSEAVAKVETPIRKELEKEVENSTNLSKEDIILNAKVAEVVAQIEQLKKDNTTISVEELDALLANAQREIQTERVLSSKKIDPEALLGDVEWELEQSFRDKVYYALGDGFQFIKTAVVERNN